MIDHTGHPHPSTPKARALCRANGGTGFIGKIGGDAPVADKKDHGKKPHVPTGPVDVTPKAPPKPPAPPKKPTVPKDHGVPKSPNPPKKPSTPKEPTAKPFNPPRNVTPKNITKGMEIKDGNGNWRKVGDINVTGGGRGSGGRHRRAAEYTFKDENGNVIRAASPNEKVTSRNGEVNGPDLPKLPPRLPPRNLAGTMKLYIPEATGKSPEAEIQNALRHGASRDFIVSKSRLQREETDATIDRILSNHGVPNHVYPRLGTGGKAPDIKAVKPTPPEKVAKKVTPDVPVKTPSVSTPELQKAKAAVDVHPEMKAKVNRVLAVQAGHVGDKIKRIRSVDSNLPEVGTPAGDRMGLKAGTLAVCTFDGHIHLHKAAHTKDDIVNRNIASGWFTPGGVGTEQTIAHEMGHALLTDFKMSANDRKELANALVETLGLTNPWGVSPNITYHFAMLDKIVQHPNNKAKIKRAVSKYGSTNMNELIAEVWSEYTMNPKPRPKIKKLGDTIKGIIERGN